MDRAVSIYRRDQRIRSGKIVAPIFLLAGAGVVWLAVSMRHEDGMTALVALLVGTIFVLGSPLLAFGRIRLTIQPGRFEQIGEFGPLRMRRVIDFVDPQVIVRLVVRDDATDDSRPTRIRHAYQLRLNHRAGSQLVTQFRNPLEARREARRLADALDCPAVGAEGDPIPPAMDPPRTPGPADARFLADHPAARLAPPPREVPATLALRALLGGGAARGWAWTGATTVVLWLLALNADLEGLVGRGYGATARGQGGACEETGARISDTALTRRRFSYGVGGQWYDGASYTTEACDDGAAAVVIEYRPSAPEVARIKGMQREPFGPLVLLVGILPLAGLVVIASALPTGLLRLRLLARGRAVTARLIDFEGTDLEVNGSQLMRFTYEIATLRGPQLVVVRGAAPTTTSGFERTVLIHDPDRSAGAALYWDQLGLPVAMDHQGRLQGTGPLRALLAVAPVALTLWAFGQFLTALLR